MGTQVGSVRAVLYAMIVASVVVAAAPAYAGTIVVDSLADRSSAAECTLFNAVQAANTDSAVGGCPAGSGDDTITFGLSGVIESEGYFIQLNTGLTIDGTGQNIVLRLTPGSVFGGTAFTVDGRLTLVRLTIDGWGGRRNLSAIRVADHRAELTVYACTLSNNVGTRGAAILSDHDGGLEVLDSIISDNVALELGGGIYQNGLRPMRISGSTFVRNRAVQGGAIYSIFGRLTVSNSTFSSNAATDAGAAIYHGDRSLFDISSSTIAGSNGSGIVVAGGVTMENTIIAGSSGTDCATIGNTIFNRIGARPNLIADGSCNVPGALTGDPMLGLLADNGGPTPTHALWPHSPAIDTGDGGVCLNLPLDQRGAPRSLDGDLDGNEVCDLGAFEYANQAPAAATDSYSTMANTPLTVAAPGVLGNDRDAEGNAMSAVLVTPPAHAAAFSFAANGSFTYAPARDYAGTDSFSYVARDAGGTSTTVAATITVAFPGCGIVITPAALAQPYLAMPYLQALGTNASGRYSYSVTAGALPPGLQLASALGVAGILGVPQAPGTYNFTITAAKSGTNCRTTKSYTVTIPPTVVPLLTCVQKINKTTYRATFGFSNTTGAAVTIPVGANNAFTPGVQNRGQSTMFGPGTVTNGFAVTFTVEREDNDIALWVLRGPDNQKRIVTVTRSTYGCQ